MTAPANSPDERTTAVGLFHFAESYRTCAEALMRGPPKSLRFDDPILFLAFHSVELYLKAYLRHRGETVETLRLQYMHKLAKTWDRAAELGLATELDPRPLFVRLDSAKAVLGHRYIVTGNSPRPDVPQFMDFIEQLRVAVHHALADDGEPVRFEDHTANGWKRV